MDRHDGETARRIDHGRKEAGGDGQFGTAGRPAEQLGQIAGERRFISRGPFAELCQHARFHFGGGVLGEGQAQDRARVRAGKKQPQNALDENVGLAGARIRPDPG